MGMPPLQQTSTLPKLNRRVFPPDVVARLGIHHVRGVLLYGPPGAWEYSVCVCVNEETHERTRSLIALYRMHTSTNDRTQPALPKKHKSIL